MSADEHHFRAGNKQLYSIYLMQGKANGIFRIGSYQGNKNQVLGKGATGSVYKGHKIDTFEPVAIKVIDMAQVNNEVTQYLLEGEKKSMSTITSANVVKTYEVIQQKQCCYLVMEQCSGGTLKDYIAKKGRLSSQEAVQLFQKILNGYKDIIEKLFIHRDLKTANILLRADGEPVIIDFGFCEMIMGKRPLIQYNVGSPAYMSPEAYGKSRYSEKSDIWALGVVLYEMLTGRTPDNGKDIKEYFRMLETEQILRLQIEGLSPVCKQLLQASFQVDPDRRATVHKLKYIVDKSLIPMMKMKLNKHYSADCQAVQPLKFMPPSHLNFKKVVSTSDRYQNNQNLSMNLIDFKRDLESPIPIKKVAFLAPKKNSQTDVISPLNYNKHLISSPLLPNTDASQNYESMPTYQNVPPKKIEPHQPHDILRKSMDRKSACKTRKQIGFSTEFCGNKINQMPRGFRIQTSMPAKDSCSLRII